MHDPHGAPPNPHASPTPPNNPRPRFSPTPPNNPRPYADSVPPNFPSPYSDPAPRSAPTHLTYPWQPLVPQAGAVSRRRPAGPALGRHSDIRILRSAYKWLRRVATITALGYFTLFLVLSAYAPQFMTLRVDGGLSAGLLLGACQLPVTLAALAVYEWRARRGVDPLSERLRRQAELEARR